MMPHRNWTGLFLGLLVPITAFEPPLYAFGPEEDEADHEALRQLKAVFEDAVNNNQLDLLKPYLHDPFSIVTYTDRNFTDFDVFKTEWQKRRDSLLAGGSYTVELIPERSLLYGDIAITLGTSENVLVTGGGDVYRFPANWTAVCRKVDGAWKIVRTHSSMDPFGNPMILAGFRKTVIQYLIGGLVGGLVLGWISAKIFARLRSKRSAA